MNSVPLFPIDSNLLLGAAIGVVATLSAAALGLLRWRTIYENPNGFRDEERGIGLFKQFRSGTPGNWHQTADSSYLQSRK